MYPCISACSWVPFRIVRRLLRMLQQSHPGYCCAGLTRAPALALPWLPTCAPRCRGTAGSARHRLASAAAASGPGRRRRRMPQPRPRNLADGPPRAARAPQTDRGFSVAHVVDEAAVPERVDLRTGAIACRTDAVHHFRCGPPAAPCRPGLAPPGAASAPARRLRVGALPPPALSDGSFPRRSPAALRPPQGPIDAGRAARARTGRAACKPGSAPACAGRF